MVTSLRVTRYDLKRRYGALLAVSVLAADQHSLCLGVDPIQHLNAFERYHDRRAALV